jgi:hypothetical protein
VFLLVRWVKAIDKGAFDVAHVLLFSRRAEKSATAHPCLKQGTVCSSSGVNAGISQTGGFDEEERHLCRKL